MRIGTNGIVVNEYGDVLLIQRDDSRTFAPPGGALDMGELPTDNVVREVREETGLIVLPVRLVGVYFWPHKPEGFLSFVFRCLKRGGELQTSAESLQVGYFKPNSLPTWMATAHFQRVMDGLNHQGGPPRWGVHPVTWQTRLGRFLLTRVVYPLKDLRRSLRREAPFQTPPDWQVAAFVVMRNPVGQVLWLKQGDVWQLPGGEANQMEPPWETAVRHTQAQTGLHPHLTNLTGVYLQKGQNDMVFVFTAEIADSPSNIHHNSAETAFFTPGDEPPTCLAFHHQHVIDAGSEQTVFRVQEQPPASFEPAGGSR